MNLTEFAVKNTAVSYFVAVLIIVGGVGSYFTMGHLEDPIFSVKKAIMVTPYPGASAEEVELEVTDRIEKAIQEVPELRHTNSHSYPGLSVIKIDTHQRYWRDKLPQVWDDIRKKIRDKLPEFPPGVGKVDISDDFNFVYGNVLEPLVAEPIPGNGQDEAVHEVEVVGDVGLTDAWRELGELVPNLLADVVPDLGELVAPVPLMGIDLDDRQSRIGMGIGVAQLGHLLDRLLDAVGDLQLHLLRARTRIGGDDDRFLDGENGILEMTHGEVTADAADKEEHGDEIRDRCVLDCVFGEVHDRFSP